MAPTAPTQEREPTALEEYFAWLNEQTLAEGASTTATIEDVVDAVRAIRDGADEE